MQGHRDQANKTIVKNYAIMPDRPQFCAMDISIATGVNIQTVRNVMNDLAAKGDIIRLRQRTNGYVYYRKATECDRIERELRLKNASAMANERGISRQRMSAILRSKGIESAGTRVTPNELDAMMCIADGKAHSGADVKGCEAFRNCARKGLVTICKVGRFNQYQLTELGMEVINDAK